MDPAIINKQKCVIKVTDYCQMKCKYCFATGVRNEQYKKRHFNFVQEFCEFWDRYKINPKNYVFNFFGGEPLLKFEEVVKPIILFLRNKSWGIGLKITTNGLLLTNEILEFLNTYHVMTILSIDGKEEVHNINRQYNPNIDVFNQVINNYKLIKNLPKTLPNSFFFGISSTFDINSIQFLLDSYQWIQTLDPKPRFWHWNIDFTYSYYNKQQFQLLCNQLSELYFLYYNSDRKIKDLYFNKIIEGKLFTFFPGLAFCTSGNIVFGSGIDEINKDNPRVYLGNLKNSSFNKELYLNLYQKDLNEALNYQYCFPLEKENCKNCQYLKSLQIINIKQKQQLFCFLQHLKEN